MGIEKKTKVQTFQWHSISWSPPFESTTQALKNALFLSSRYNSQSNQMDFPERFWLLESWQTFGSSISLLSIVLVKLASVSLVYLTIETFLPFVVLSKELIYSLQGVQFIQSVGQRQVFLFLTPHSLNMI